MPTNTLRFRPIVPHEAIIVIGEIKRVNLELNQMFRLLALLDSRSDSTHLLNVARDVSIIAEMKQLFSCSGIALLT